MLTGWFYEPPDLTWERYSSQQATFCDRTEGSSLFMEVSKLAWKTLLCLVFQGLWPTGCGTLGPVLQAGWAAGHETANVWVEELEQCHMPAAGCGCQAPWLHCTHVQPDAAYWHVDGPAPHAQELGPQGQHTQKRSVAIAFKGWLEFSKPDLWWV